ncbi:MAG TPA: hypothetical protein VE172_20160 [Stackebrandtia sp.]|jgi:Ca2+:H+ antiporter|uniref:calcium:proton antiporter n=1 Tax=Stackebrandtia sp. TaxID=2023065 RepID=UPI002D3B4356|nr:hypothetical protein [Stackebrandtia sp.]HZE41120.1 hypothetical protein [Stackebrandtia sp.]
MAGVLRWTRDRWTTWAPLLALAAFGLSLSRKPSTLLVIAIAVLLGGAVLAAVHHAEVVAHRVGEPLGSLVLAVSVTIIEVALILTLMASGNPDAASSLARDTVFAAVMITCNGIVGVSLLVGGARGRTAVYNAEGTGSALAAVATLATLSLVLPTFTTTRPGPQFTAGQLAFAAVASLVLYGIFVTVQTRRERDSFLPVDAAGEVIAPDEGHVRPATRQFVTSLVLLMVALVAVVGDAKAVSSTVESGVRAAGLPQSVVGVVIAMLVLAPETLAAARAARRGRTQTSLNLAYGSAMASIGLTIPAIAVASIWMSGPLILGLGATHMVLLALTVVVGILTAVPGRANLLHAGIHLSLLAAFVFLAISP